MRAPTTSWRDSPEAVDAELDDVARLQIDRRRLHAEPDARRRAGADHVARQQRHELAHVADERRARRRPCSRSALLSRSSPLTVSHMPSACGSGISSRGREERADRRERVAALALDPLAAALELERALGVVVVQRVAGDVVHRACFVHVRRRAPDHDGELDLPVELRAAARDRRADRRARRSRSSP